MAVGAGEVNSIHFYWFKMFILWLCSLAIITHEVQRVKVVLGDCGTHLLVRLVVQLG